MKLPLQLLYLQQCNTAAATNDGCHWLSDAQSPRHLQFTFLSFFHWPSSCCCRIFYTFLIMFLWGLSLFLPLFFSLWLGIFTLAVNQPKITHTKTTVNIHIHTYINIYKHFYNYFWFFFANWLRARIANISRSTAATTTTRRTQK